MKWNPKLAMDFLKTQIHINPISPISVRKYILITTVVTKIVRDDNSNNNSNTKIQKSSHRTNPYKICVRFDIFPPWKPEIILGK